MSHQLWKLFKLQNVTADTQIKIITRNFSLYLFSRFKGFRLLKRNKCILKMANVTILNLMTFYIRVAIPVYAKNNL